MFVDALKSTVATLKVSGRSWPPRCTTRATSSASVLEKLRLSDDGRGTTGEQEEEEELRARRRGGGSSVPRGVRPAMVQSLPHDEELRRLGLLVDAGAMTPLVRMCAGAKGYLPPKEPVPPSPVKGESSHAKEDKGEVAQEEASAGEGGGAAEGDADDDANAEGEGDDDGGGGDGEGADGGDEKADADADGEGDGEGGGGGEEEGGGKKKKKKGKRRAARRRPRPNLRRAWARARLAAGGLAPSVHREPEGRLCGQVGRSPNARAAVEGQGRPDAVARAGCAVRNRGGISIVTVGTSITRSVPSTSRVSAIRRQQPMRPSVKFVSAPVESAWLKTGAA